MARVVKLAQPGYDVQTAGDENLIYNSNWPLLKIFQTGSVKLGAGANDVKISHGLGYAPMFWYFGNNQLSDALIGASPTVINRSEFNAQLGFTAYTTPKIIGFISDDFFAGPVQLQYYIFALDLDMPYTAPSINLGKQPQGAPPANVFKIAKPGKSVHSSRLEDFAVHSLTRSPLLQAVYPVTAVDDASLSHGSGFIYYHKLGYVPIYFLYRQGSVTGRWFLPGILGLGSQADTEKITINLAGVTGSRFSLVVLKDPFTIDYAVEVKF